MSERDPRVCCWACERADDPDECRDVFCSCHDGVALLGADEAVSA